MIAVLPGLGATGAMYEGPWRDVPQFRFIDWPVDSGIITLDALADWVCSEVPDASVFIGSSLGGMVSLLCASKLGVERVALLGSATSYAEVSRFCQSLQPLSQVLPFALLKWLSGSVPLPLARMYAQQDAVLMRSLLLDLPNFVWSDPNVEVLRIHGRRDHVIPCPPAADVLLDAGHLIAMSHAAEVCRVLKERGFSRAP